MKKYHIYKLNIKKLNIISILLLVICILFTIIFFPNSMKEIMMLYENIKYALLIIPLMVFYFILHELLHALGYIIHGANPKKITFGAEIEKGVFYCLCKDEITRTNILFSLMYPLFFIGIVTYIIGIIFNYPILILLSILNISGAAGDIMYFIFFIKLDKDIMFSEMDDGTSFAIISKNDPNKHSHFGLDYVGVEKKISREDFKRVRITKTSKIFLLVALVILIIGVLI